MRCRETTPELDVARLVRGWRKDERKARQWRKLRLRGGVQLHIALDMHRQTLQVRTDDGRRMHTRVLHDHGAAVAHCPACGTRRRYLYLLEEGWGCRECRQGQRLPTAAALMHQGMDGHDLRAMRQAIRRRDYAPLVLASQSGGAAAITARRAMELEWVVEERLVSLRPLFHRRRDKKEFLLKWSTPVSQLNEDDPDDG